MSSITIPVDPKPTPAGAFQVGRASLVLPSDTPDRPLAVDLWYPVAGDTAGQEALSSQKLPLLLYAPGWGGRGTSNALLLGELVGAGYAVAVIDDVGARPEDGSDAAADFDIGSAEALKASLALANRRLDAMVLRASHTLDHLLAPAGHDQANPLAGRLDPDKVAMLGYSFGGAVAAELSRRDRRVKATINFDGWLFGEAATEGARPPYLVINSDFPNLAASTRSFSAGRRNSAALTLSDRRTQQRQSCLAGYYALYYERIDHGDLTDQLFAPDLLNYLKFWRRTKEERLEIFASLKAYTLAFLARHLRGDPAPGLLDLAQSPYDFVHRTDPQGAAVAVECVR